MNRTCESNLLVFIKIVGIERYTSKNHTSYGFIMSLTIALISENKIKLSAAEMFEEHVNIKFCVERDILLL